jgi:hypothetical protein
VPLTAAQRRGHCVLARYSWRLRVAVPNVGGALGRGKAESTIILARIAAFGFAASYLG